MLPITANNKKRLPKGIVPPSDELKMVTVVVAEAEFPASSVKVMLYV